MKLKSARIPNSNNTSKLRAAPAVARDLGITTITLWRWQKAGWIKTVNINRLTYIDMESLKEFEQRAQNGEFSKPFKGAAGASHEKKTAMQQQ